MTATERPSSQSVRGGMPRLARPVAHRRRRPRRSRRARPRAASMAGPWGTSSPISLATPTPTPGCSVRRCGASGRAVRRRARGTGRSHRGRRRPRRASELRDDVERSTADLEAAWAAMTPEAWDGHGLSRGRPWPCRPCPSSAGVRSRSITSTPGRGTGPRTGPRNTCGASCRGLLATSRTGSATRPQRRRLLAWLTGGPRRAGELDLARWESRPGNYFKGISD